MSKEDIYVELPRESITFYGDTEQEKKLNEMLFDMSLENDSLYEENKKLLKINRKYKEVIDKAILELVNIDGDLSYSQLSDRICNLINMLKEVE